MFQFLKFSSMFFILSLEMKGDVPKRIEDYTYMYLLIVSPQYVPNQQKQSVCSAIMLVEDIFYLTAKSCFDEVVHDRRIKIAMSRKKEPLFDILIYEDFIMKSRDLQRFVVLQKDGIDLVVEKYQGRSIEGHKYKNPYVLEDLLEPRVLLAHPDNPSFTHCYCLGWGSYTQTDKALSNLKLAFTSSRVHATKLKVGNEVLVELEEGENIVADYGSSLMCEVKNRNKISVSAVVGIFTGVDDKEDYIKNGLVTYRSFSGTLEALTRWAIGTNVSVTENLYDWTLWPVHPLFVEPEGDNSKTKSSANDLSECKFLYKLIGSIYATQYFWKYYI